MVSYFNRISEKTFLIIAPILSFLGDLLIIFYILNTFSNYEYFQKMFEIYLNATGKSLDQQFFKEVFDLMMQYLKLLLIFYLFFHIVQYVFFYKKKSFAILYIQIMTIVAAPGCLLFALSEFPTTKLLPNLFFIQGLFYTYILIGILKFKDIKNREK